MCLISQLHFVFHRYPRLIPVRTPPTSGCAFTDLVVCNAGGGCGVDGDRQGRINDAANDAVAHRRAVPPAAVEPGQRLQPGALRAAATSAPDLTLIGL